MNYYAESKLQEELLNFTAEHRRDVSAKYFSIYYDEDYREYDVDVEL